MRRRTAGVAATLTVIVTSLFVSAVPALASGGNSFPDTVVRVRSLDWNPHGGTVAVTARVKCTGDGHFSWQASLKQKHARAKGSVRVPCDGVGALSTMVLDPRMGRFHPGVAQFEHGSITVSGDLGIGYYTVEPIRISAR